MSMLWPACLSHSQPHDLPPHTATAAAATLLRPCVDGQQPAHQQQTARACTLCRSGFLSAHILPPAYACACCPGGHSSL